MQTADPVQEHGVTRTYLHLEDEAGQTQGLMTAPCILPGTCRGAPSRRQLALLSAFRLRA